MAPAGGGSRTLSLGAALSAGGNRGATFVEAFVLVFDEDKGPAVR